MCFVRFSPDYTTFNRVSMLQKAFCLYLAAWPVITSTKSPVSRAMCFEMSKSSCCVLWQNLCAASGCRWRIVVRSATSTQIKDNATADVDSCQRWLSSLVSFSAYTMSAYCWTALVCKRDTGDNLKLAPIDNVPRSNRRETSLTENGAFIIYRKDQQNAIQMSSPPIS